MEIVELDVVLVIVLGVMTLCIQPGNGVHFNLSHLNINSGNKKILPIHNTKIK
jgi:hypothetical protein